VPQNRLYRHPTAIALVGIAALMLATTPLQATTARLAGLGGGDFIEDDHNVQRWYGSLGDYPGLVVLEAGHFTLPDGWHDDDGNLVSGPGLGAHLALDRAGRWGTAALFINGRSDDVDPGGLARDRMSTVWSAMWSRRFDRLQPTLVYRHTADSGEEAAMPASVRHSWDRARTELGAGLRWDLSDGAYLDLAGEVCHHREQTSVSDSVITIPGSEHKTTGSFGLRARAFVRLSQAVALVPVLDFLRDDRALPAPSPIRTLGVDGHLFKFGTGLNWYPDPDHFLILGLDYLHADEDFLATPPDGPTVVESTRVWDSFSFTLGFESRFRYWLTFRGSLRYEPVNFGDRTSTGEEDFATFMVNLGAAIQLADYDLDMAVTDQEPTSVTGYYGHSLFENPATWVTVSLRRAF